MRSAFALALALATSVAHADVRLATIKLYGGGSSCSGVFVSSDGLALTARHCNVQRGFKARLRDGRVFNVQSSKTLGASGWEDDVVSLRVDTGGLPVPYVRVAQALPAIGAQVFACGHAGGVNALSMYVGTVLSHSQAPASRITRMLTTTQACSFGVSGGPLFTMDGELVGICSAIDHPDGRESYWVPLERVQLAIASAPVPQQADSRPELVAFVLGSGCPPCERFKRDVSAGKFANYDVTIVSYDRQSGVWSHPDLYSEAQPALRGHFGNVSSFPAPVFWIRGTNHVRSGYGSDGPGGLIGWILGLGGIVKDALVGPDPPNLVPAESGVPIRDEKYERSITSQLSALKQSAEEAAALAAKAKADLEDFKSSGPIGKLRMIDDLKEDAAKAKALAEDARSRVVDVREHPLQYLWSLLGAVLGIIKRRFLDRSEQ